MKTLLSCLFGLSFYTLNLDAAIVSRIEHWPLGEEIVVLFLDGTPEQQRLVQKVALEWTRYANLRLRFSTQVEQPSHLRISFTQYDGSILGRQPKTISTAPTMLLASVSRNDLSSTYKKRVILHEFGHALGFEHEYRHPRWPYGDAVFRSHVDHCKADLPSAVAITPRDCYALHNTVSASDYHILPFDRLSIMQYPTPLEHLEHTLESIPLTTSLSAIDQLAASLVYPSHDQFGTGLNFENRCHLPVTVYWQTESHDLTIFRLAPYQRSKWFAVEPVTVQWRAVTTPALQQWKNTLSNDGMMTVPKSIWLNGRLHLPLYCDR